MDLATLVQWTLKISIFLTVLALGLDAGPSQARFLFVHPRRLIAATLSLFVLMPLVAVGLNSVFQFHDSIEIALIALSVSPVPPLLPRKALKAGGGLNYTIGLLVAASVLAVIFIPITVELAARAFGREAHVPMAMVLRVVLGTVIIPLALGMTVRALAPSLAERLVDGIGRLAFVLVVISALPLVVHVWPDMRSLLGNGTLAALAVFTALGLFFGHALGGPMRDDRTVLALSTGCRHPGVALSVGIANVQGDPRVLAAIALYLLVSVVFSTAYLLLRRHHS